MVKKIEKLFKSYRDQLLHLAKLYGVVEIKSYARSAKRLTISQLELLLIKNNIKLPINRSSARLIEKHEIRTFCSWLRRRVRGSWGIPGAVRVVCPGRSCPADRPSAG